MFAFLPVDKVIVTAIRNTRDSGTGDEIQVPILSVLFEREQTERIKWQYVDPSEALKNFSHRVDFKKLKGFAPIEPIRLEGDEIPVEG